MFFIFIKVLRKVINILPFVPSVSRVVVDFEKALWSAFKSVLSALQSSENQTDGVRSRTLIPLKTPSLTI